MAHLHTDPTLLAAAVMSERCGRSRVSVFKMSLLFERPFPRRGDGEMRNAYGCVDPLLMEDPRRPCSPCKRTHTAESRQILPSSTWHGERLMYAKLLKNRSGAAGGKLKI